MNRQQNINEMDQIKSFIKSNLTIILKIVAGITDVKSNEMFMILDKEIDLLDVVFSFEKGIISSKQKPKYRISQRLLRNGGKIDSQQLYNFLRDQLTIDQSKPLGHLKNL